MCLQILKIHPLQRGLMGGGETHGRRTSRIKRFLPTRDAQAPAITGLKAGEIPFGSRCGEVVAAQKREIQKLMSRLNADSVQPDISRAGAAVAIAIEPGHGFATATGEWFAEDVGAHEGL